MGSRRERAPAAGQGDLAGVVRPALAGWSWVLPDGGGRVRITVGSLVLTTWSC